MKSLFRQGFFSTAVIRIHCQSIRGVLQYLLLSPDGTDGKQARRTNTCGPLGELFDHGLDSWAVSLLTITVFSIFGRGDFSVGIDRLFYLLLLTIYMFHITHWEKYNSGVLYLPWSYDISQYVSSRSSLFTAIRRLIITVIQ